MRFWFCVLIVLLILIEEANATRIHSLNLAELAFTDNANLMGSDRVSDIYFRVSSFNTFAVENQNFGLRLSYQDYVSESQNDVLSIRLLDRWIPHQSKWKYTFAFFGHYFPQGGSGTTDTSFNNFGGEVNAMTPFIPSHEAISIEYGGGGRIFHFPSFSGRSDFNPFAVLDFDYDVTKRLRLFSSIEGGLLLSTLSEYSKVYLRTGGLLVYALPSRWSLEGQLWYEPSIFMNRVTTTETVVRKNRGRVITSTESQLETHNHVTFGVEFNRQQTDRFEFGVGLKITNQQSASGLEDYTELQGLGH